MNVHSPSRLSMARRELEQLARDVLPHCFMPHFVIQAGNDPDKFDAEKWSALAVLVAEKMRRQVGARVKELLTSEGADELIAQLASSAAEGKK
jgi:hypothetical protein